jgi:hypothetical protein
MNDTQYSDSKEEDINIDSKSYRSLLDFIIDETMTVNQIMSKINELSDDKILELKEQINMKYKKLFRSSKLKSINEKDV